MLCEPNYENMKTNRINHNSKSNSKVYFPLQKTVEILKWVNTHFIKSKSPDVNDYILFWCNCINKKVIHNGPLYAIQYFKTVRLHVTRYLSGSPLLINSNNVRVDKRGIPSILGPLKDLVEEAKTDDTQARLVNTLLILSRVIEGGHSNPDLNVLTSPNNCQVEKYYQEVTKALQSLGIPTNQQPPVFKDYHPSTKSGPNGQALVTSINDAFG